MPRRSLEATSGARRVHFSALASRPASVGASREEKWTCRAHVGTCEEALSEPRGARRRPREEKCSRRARVGTFEEPLLEPRGARRRPRAEKCSCRAAVHDPREAPADPRGSPEEPGRSLEEPREEKWTRRGSVAASRDSLVGPCGSFGATATRVLACRRPGRVRSMLERRPRPGERELS